MRNAVAPQVPLAIAALDHDDDAVPRDIMRTLAETFFTHNHLAPLVLHKETFLANLEAGKVDPMLSLAVAALSSR
jgi:predicted transcriptional regulator